MHLILAYEQMLLFALHLWWNYVWFWATLRKKVIWSIFQGKKALISALILLIWFVTFEQFTLWLYSSDNNFLKVWLRTTLEKGLLGAICEERSALTFVLIYIHIIHQEQYNLDVWFWVSLEKVDDLEQHLQIKMF